MIISLTGFMGSGKSSVGKMLPALLDASMGHFDFIDLDDYIVSSEGRSVNVIFEQGGENGFRRIETRCLNGLLETYRDKNLVLALGGGTAVFNPELVHSRTICVYLSASVDTLVSRLASDTSRPLLACPSADASRPLPTDPSADASGNERSESREKGLRNRIERLFASREATYLRVAHHTVATDGLSVAVIAAIIAKLF